MNKIAVAIAIIVLVILLLGDQNISPFLHPSSSGWWNWGYRADGTVGSLPVGWYLPTRYPFWYPYY